MTERPTYARSSCCIPGCPRWSRRFPGEWMCGRHWKLVGAKIRKALRLAWQRREDAYSRWSGTERTEEVSRLWQRLDRLAERFWALAKRRVILREAGL